MQLQPESCKLFCHINLSARNLASLKDLGPLIKEEEGKKQSHELCNLPSLDTHALGRGRRKKQESGRYLCFCANFTLIIILLKTYLLKLFAACW